MNRALASSVLSYQAVLTLAHGRDRRIRRTPDATFDRPFLRDRVGPGREKIITPLSAGDGLARPMLVEAAPWPRVLEERPMRVMVLVKATADSEAGIMPSRELIDAMDRFNAELVEAGILLAGEGLHPSAKGRRIAFDGAERSVVEGPFAATGELVAGFWLWQVADMAEAVDWVKRCPNPMPGPSEIEIRPLYEAADFA